MADHLTTARAGSEVASPLEGKTTLSITEIQAILPHRYPSNEPFFQGHFPGFPIMPGVLIVEAMAQAGGALLLTEVPDREHKLMVFTGIERAKFRKPVVPGDQLRIEVEVIVWRSTAVKMRGLAYVDGKLACEASISCALVNR